MLRKTTSSILVSALILSVGVTSASAQSISDPLEGGVGTRLIAAVQNDTLSGPRTNEKLRSDIEKLLSDARAGKVVPTDVGQIKPAKSNNLSTGAKIAIGVGIAVVVIALIVKHQKDHLFDDLRLGN